MEFSNELKKATLKTAFHYLEKNPEENIHRIMAAIDKFAGDGPDSFPTQREAFRNVLENPDNNMYQLIMSVLKDNSFLSVFLRHRDCRKQLRLL